MIIKMALLKRKKKKQYIYLTPLGKIVALGEVSLRAREEGKTIQEILDEPDDFIIKK